MSLRGKAAIVGIGELPTQRVYVGRTMYSLAAEAAHMAIRDAGLRKQDIDGLITEGGGVAPGFMAEQLEIRPVFATGVTMMGASGATATAVAAAAINAGMCNNVLVVLATAREPNAAFRDLTTTFPVMAEFEAPYGPAAAANTGYGMLYNRHMYEFGTTEEQLAKVAVDERFNALTNPNAAFKGQPITKEDVLNSRYINHPLKLLESVMPCAGAVACIITSAERAKARPHRPAYILGAGIEQAFEAYYLSEMFTVLPAKVSTARAFEMAGYNVKDMQFAEFYD